jgi:hypothetical protein
MRQSPYSAGLALQQGYAVCGTLVLDFDELFVSGIHFFRSGGGSSHFMNECLKLTIIRIRGIWLDQARGIRVCVEGLMRFKLGWSALAVNVSLCQ